MTSHQIFVAFILFIAVDVIVVAVFAAGVYNGLISLKKQVERAWSNIDVILKQRHDMIPQLVSVCEQYAQYERSTLEYLVNARKSYGTGSREDQIKMDQNISTSLKGIFAIGEAYPELKSSNQFLQIQNSLSQLESQLADRRELYNDSATNFNTRIEQLPDVFFARMLGYQSVHLYKIDPAETQAPSLTMKLPA